MNIINKIQHAIAHAIATDEDGNDKQADILKQEYIDATPQEKKAIDRIFIALCGWSLKTLLEGRETVEYNPYK